MDKKTYPSTISSAAVRSAELNMYKKINVNKLMQMDESLSDIKLRVYHKCHPAELHTPGTNIIDSSIHLN